ncbi:MAG: helix-turn-helix domain-containing protein, partial [Gammaproteobacteria bacterium]|nr:helix-turn-helix domain-containing protein [Gammaproteobacteria bacterium]
MLTAYCYRVYPTNVQQQTLRRQFGAVRFVYNYFLALQTRRFEDKKKHLSFFDMCRELVELKRSDDYSWLYLTYAQSLYEGLKNLDAAYQN